jgi:hypothetical protein
MIYIKVSKFDPTQWVNLIQPDPTRLIIFFEIFFLIQY